MGRDDVSHVGGSIARADKVNRQERVCALSWPAECGAQLCRTFARPEACFGIAECIRTAAGVNISASRSIVFERNEPAAAGWDTISALSVLDENRTLYAPGRENTSSKRGKHYEGRERVHSHRGEHHLGREDSQFTINNYLLDSKENKRRIVAPLTIYEIEKSFFFRGKYI